MLINIVLFVGLSISLFTDIKSRRILNIVTFPSMLIALTYHIATLGWEGFVFSSKGLSIGVGLLLIPYLLGGMGAGDVKLMAAIGALMGTSFVFYSFIYTALIGGFISLFLLVKQKGLVNLLRLILYNVIFFRSNLSLVPVKKENHSNITFPYGVAIVIGTFCTFVWGGY